MTTRELYTQGARIWLPHAEKVWEGAEVTQDFRGGSLIVKTEDGGQIRQIKIEKDADLPHLRNPSILEGQNDLTTLSYLHEPAVLHNLRVRFCDRSDIYTYCGIVLVAINPYSELDIYGRETIMVYRGRAMGDLDPHIFAVSEEAYTKLERENRDQSIIVSGESGAGKTVSAKYAMRYFAAVGGSSSETQVEKKVLASSPIMEAIGNAKTTRNDNSSRFGKFIQINFNRAYRIVGASMRTYLLEKSRVVFQAPEERNYHVFYQLCSARDRFPELRLDDPEEFFYLRQGGNAYIDGVNDAKTFQETMQAMTTLGFSDSEQMELFKVLAALLHLGNINICDGNPEDFGPDETYEDGGFIHLHDKHLAHFTEILGIPTTEVRRWLTHRRIASATEVIETRMEAEKACAARDALAKRIYAEMFNWCVRGVNRALHTTASVHHFIGVLDIYGFETFEVNSFEQFCINYANEKLQQQFNSHVFKLEQEEYLKEGITWKMISFYDNQPCIDLIESKLGVLALLDEECRIPKGSDLGWTAKLRDKCSQYSHFAAPRFGEDSFIIKHFADDVTYQSAGFLDKNRDTVFEEQLELLRMSRSCRLMVEIISGEAVSKTLGATLPVPQRRKIGTDAPIKPHFTQPASNKAHRATVGAQFRASLADLMATLSATTPHYVRCIKPNDAKAAFVYDSARAVQQLRACGVLETIRISAAGFPSRWLYQDFYQRYRLLCHSSEEDRNDIILTCKKTLLRHIKDPDKYQFGETKIFFRAGQVAYLEKIRSEKRQRYALLVQSRVRGFLARRMYKKVMKAIVGVQTYGRGFMARIKAQEIRRNRAATIIQKNIRRWLARLRFLRLRTVVHGLQAYARGYLARRKYLNMKLHAAAITVQRYIRGFLTRKHYAETRRKIIICQAAIRRFIARRHYKRLKTEARSIEHVKKLNRGLENKIITLQQRLSESKSENKQLQSLHKTIADMKAKMDTLKLLEPTVKELKASLFEKDSLLSKVQAQLTEERDNSVQLADERAKLSLMYKSEKEKWDGQKEKYENELEELNRSNKRLESENAMKVQTAAETVTLAAELDQEKAAYQKLIAKFNDLQGRMDGESRLRAREHKRSLSNVSSLSPADGPNYEEYEYSSVDPGLNSQGGAEAINWTMSTTTGPASGDNKPNMQSRENLASLSSALVRLQKRATAAENQRALEEKMVMKLQARLSTRSTINKVESDTEDRFKLDELEIENKKLQEDLDRLRRCGKGEDYDKELIDQFANLQEELVRRREECIQLRSVLAKQTVNFKSLASSNYGSDVDVMNEDGELAQAFETQKKITRQLEEELTAEKKFYSEMLSDLKADLERVNDDFEKLQKLHASALNSEIPDQAEIYLQFELARVIRENTKIQERNNVLSESCRNYKNQIRILLEKLKEAGYENPSEILDTLEVSAFNNTNMTMSIRASNDMVPAVRKKEREYIGMFEFRREDDKLVVQRLILELSPRTAIQLLPGLPAYIILMCIRHCDHMNDEGKVQSLLTNVVNAIKKIVRKCKEPNNEYIVLWLSNTVRLLHNLRQYSGDSIYQSHNTPRQNQQALQLFDLSDFRQVISDTAIFVYQALVTMLEHQLERLIVPALLEHDAISGVGGSRRASQATPSSPPPKGAPASPPSPSPRLPEALKSELSVIKTTLDYHGVAADLIMRIFKQLFYYICAYSLNQLVLRKDLCCWAKGMQIRYNLSHLEVWAKETFTVPQHLEEIVGTLKPITQAVHLLQSRKTIADVQSTVDMCPDLSTTQICKILNLYTPAEDFPQNTAKEFIRQIQMKMAERNQSKASGEQQTLLMDSKFKFAVQFPFNPSDIRLEDIELPDVLNLSDVLNKV